MTLAEPLKRGDRVRNELKPDWGLGEVLEDQIGDRVDLIFENAKFTDHNGISVPYRPFNVTRFTHIIRIIGRDSESDDLSWLVNRYRRRPKNKKAVSGPVGDVRSFDGAVKKFLDVFPAGFQDPEYLRREREYKLKARKQMLEKLGPEEMNGLLSAGNFDEIWKLAHKVMATSEQIVHYRELSELDKALNSPGRRHLFSDALATLLWSEAPVESRFKAFANMLRETKTAKWPVATYFLFLAFPETQILLKPSVIQYFAEICKKQIDYSSEVEWVTYKNVLDLAQYTRKELTKLGQEKLVPKDMIDVQSFMWIVVKYGPEDAPKAVSPII